jgi:DNA-binding NtrC family response regulator
MSQIVIAEDDTELSVVICEMLTDKGFQVLQAPDGVAALQVLEANPGVSLLLSDVKMPRMGGHELVERALRMHPQLKVLMMTGYVGEFPSPAALKAREIRTLAKPFNFDRLCDLVEQMLARP